MCVCVCACVCACVLGLTDPSLAEEGTPSVPGVSGCQGANSDTESRPTRIAEGWIDGVGGLGCGRWAFTQVGRQASSLPF